MSSRWQGRWICCRAGFSGGFPFFTLTLSTTFSGHWPPGGIGISPLPTRRGPDCRLGGNLSPLIVSIICHPTRSRLRPHRDSQVHIQRAMTCLMCRITGDLGGG
ncbi:hypothetical protein PIB30_047516 [Stylosanthes scabra]|uniref:Secreted protein n=1 Tax=Stylosanthes scabra TaxID=79078 RepID=A0ABU6XIC2_9FABA|nr:hypothetical protein [Stylosanthes scabra]